MAGDDDPKGRVLTELELILAASTALAARTAALEALIYADAYSQLTTGQATFPRLAMGSTAALTVSQTLRLSYFTAMKALNSTQTRIVSGGTPAGATPTLCRLGLYLIAANGGGTLVASTANDTSLFAAGSTTYTKSWSAPYTLVAGQRYAYAILVVTGATPPTLCGAVAASADEFAVAPRLTGSIAAQTDLPASFAGGSVAVSTSNRHYAVVLP